MGQADALPDRMLKWINGGMMAGLISGDGGKEIEGAVAVRHADLESGSGFDGEAEIVKPDSQSRRNLSDVVHGMRPAIVTQL